MIQMTRSAGLDKATVNLAHEVIAAAIEVHKIPRPGFLTPV